MEEAEQTSTNPRKEASVSLSSVNNGGRQAVLHYTSAPSNDDAAEDSWLWKHRFMRGWLFAPNDPKSAKENEQSNEARHRRQVRSFSEHLRGKMELQAPIPWRRGGFRQRAMTRMPLRTKHRTTDDAEEVGYSREDYMCLLTECRGLQQKQDKWSE